MKNTAFVLLRDNGCCRCVTILKTSVPEAGYDPPPRARDIGVTDSAGVSQAGAARGSRESAGVNAERPTFTYNQGSRLLNLQVFYGQLLSWVLY